MLIKDFNDRKVCDYLDTGAYRNVLIRFRHGLGDAVMFYCTCLKALRRRYPDIRFAYSTHLGQEDIFGRPDDNPDHYDIAFEIVYPMSEWDPGAETKSEKCARLELGLPLPLAEEYSLPRSYPSPLVGLHFNVTCLPFMDATEEFGRRLWTQVVEEGLIPVDTHMRHYYDNKSKSIIHPFEQCRRVDDIPATTDKLLGLLSCLRGFAGVPSGNLACALALMPPHRVMYLTSAFAASKQTHLGVFEMNITKPYDAVLVKDWLDGLKADME